MDDDNGKSDNYMHTSVSGAMNQHTPPYWRLVLPALGARYIGRYAQHFTGASSKVFDGLAGAWMLGITAFFAHRTGRDMMNVFSEAVAYEFDKKPSDVTVSDILASKNNAVRAARSNYIKYNLLRAVVNSTFFVSFLPGKFGKVDSVDLGVGANGVYLMSEVLGRERTLFEQVQGLIESKINQENSMGENITSLELIHLFQRNAKDNDPKNVLSAQSDTVTWKQSQIVFEYMAELMNNTYQHKNRDKKDNFTLPKFLYLIGHNLIQPKNVEQTLAYIEVANHYGMPALKQVVQAVKDGTDLQYALRQFPLLLPDKLKQASQEQEVKPSSGRKYAESIMAKGDNIRPALVSRAEKGDESFVSRVQDQTQVPGLRNTVA